MLNRLMAASVAMCVLWHALVGCCAHHRHALAVSSPAVAHDCGHHGRHAHATADDDCTPEGDAFRHDGRESTCDGESQCVLSAGERSGAVSGAEKVRMCADTPLSMQVAYLPVRMACDHADFTTRPPLMGALRAHLALHVLLI